MQTATATSENTKTGKSTFADVALVSELKEKGWRVEGSGREWKAYEIANETNIVGPATSVKALYEQLQLVVGNFGDKEPEAKNGNGNGKTKTVGKSTLANGKYEDAKKGQSILPGVEAAVFADMESAGRELRKTTMEILRLQKIQKTQQDTCEQMMEKFKDDLEYDPETKERFFTVNVEGEPVDVVYETKETHSVKTRKARA